MYMASIWTLLNPRMTIDQLGYLPMLIGPKFPGTVAEQLRDNYAHGGGYDPFGENLWKLDPKTHVLSYPDDPQFHPLATTKVRDETLYFYNHAILAIVQPDGSFAVTRVD